LYAYVQLFHFNGKLPINCRTHVGDDSLPKTVIPVPVDTCPDLSLTLWLTLINTITVVGVRPSARNVWVADTEAVCTCLFE